MSDFNPAFKEAYEQPEKKKTSGCVKVLIIVLVLGVVASLGCCIGGIFWMRSAVTEDPVRITTLSNKILDWDGNDEIQPVLGLDMWIFRFAFFAERGKGSIILVDTRMGEAEAMGQQMEDQFKGQMELDDFEETDVVKRDDREFNIRGTPVTLQFNQSEGVDSKQKYWEVSGVIDGNDYPTFFFIRLMQDAYSEERVQELVESIR